MLLYIYDFFETTIWATILLSLLIGYYTYYTGSNKKEVVLLSSYPIVLVIISILLSMVTSSIYPSRLNESQMNILFLYLPIVFLLYYFYDDEEKRSREKTIKGYIITASVIFVFFALFHPVPKPSMGNDYFSDAMDYPCSPKEMHTMERNRNILMIGCMDNIHLWAEKKDTYICSVQRNAIDKIYAIDNDFNEYLFDQNCKFIKKTGNYDFVIDDE